MGFNSGFKGLRYTIEKNRTLNAVVKRFTSMKVYKSPAIFIIQFHGRFQSDTNTSSLLSVNTTKNGFCFISFDPNTAALPACKTFCLTALSKIKV